MAFLALLRRESWWLNVSVGDSEEQKQAAHLVFVRVAAQTIARALRSGLLTVGLHRRCERVGRALISICWRQTHGWVSMSYRTLA